MDKDKLIISCQIPLNRKAIIRELRGNIDVVTRLREMGLGEGVIISKSNLKPHDDNCIVINLKGQKLYLNEQAAHSIFVELK